MATLGPMPPHGVIDDFLPDAERLALLTWAVGEQSAFKPAKVFTGEGGRQQRINPDSRRALRHPGLGPFESLMRTRLLARLPQIMAAAGYNGPEPRSIEFELNAYGEGAHFAPQIDIPLGPRRRATDERKGEDKVRQRNLLFLRRAEGLLGRRTETLSIWCRSVLVWESGQHRI